MLRFAPSPTGDMHIGDLRVALLNYIVSKQKKEDFIVRIEDTQKEKNVQGKDQEILDILDLFGIKYSQTIYQSQNFKFHSAMALQLMHDKKAFSCFCSDEWIEKKYKEAKDANKEYSYDDACKNLPDELVIDNTNPFRIRITRPANDILIEDKIKGNISFTPDEVDSFEILHQDKTSTYSFACAVDDMISDISIIIRDEKHIKNTPRQEHIRKSLGYEKDIEYAHLPSISNEEDFSVKYLLEQGFLPEAISNYLISIENKTSSDIFSLEEAVKFFDLKNIPNSPAHFNIDTLKNINKKYLINLDAKELSRYVGFADTEIGELARIYLEDDVSTTKELKAKIEPIFSTKKIPKNFEVIVKVIKNAPYFDEYKDFKDYIIKEIGAKEKDIIEPLIYILTGSNNTPDIAKVYKYIKNYIGEIVK
ncbi:glutamate--tRNA ligase [Sulfurimonas lithotrophica]|uniref:Glutamate--tRNA ligase n=1 Tax=Sulfurimonas lithotrophica TaxID=2590022 RepID=A0A5P8P111_9BACT|nr:glutamate--tRNA ligase [Sulfurimonas lithotrophica]QFR49291.1 glutamate--tRNA ligase [Sulfurimonas lithotrophica]